MQPTSENRWQTNWVRTGYLWKKQSVKPAEIAEGLRKAVLAQENVLEDADYNKVAPNHFIVEVSQGNYLRHYEPIRENLIRQWRDRLVDHLMTANSRLGRKEYRFGGQLQIELRFAPDLADSQARILTRVNPEISSADGDLLGEEDRSRVEAAYLEDLDQVRRWSLYEGENTIGRSSGCDVYLDLPPIQERRLVSGQHAVIRIEAGRAFLFDGSPSGKPSANGTFVNTMKVSSQGAALKDGDIIILAALDPLNPRVDTPGAAVFRFRQVQ